jgi:hypothetical protein
MISTIQFSATTCPRCGIALPESRAFHPAHDSLADFVCIDCRRELAAERDRALSELRSRWPHLPESVG